MDARIGFPNEHLAGDSDEALSSPSYATAVGLLMEGLEKDVKEDEFCQTNEGAADENQDGSLQGAKSGGEEKTTLQKKTFFEKFTEGLKDFLDNAE